MVASWYNPWNITETYEKIRSFFKTSKLIQLVNLAQNLVISWAFLAFSLAKTEPGQSDPGWPIEIIPAANWGSSGCCHVWITFCCGKCTNAAYIFLKHKHMQIISFLSNVNYWDGFGFLKWSFKKNNKFCTHFLNLIPPKTNVTETTFTNHLGRFVSPSSQVTGDSPAIVMLVFWRFLEGICCLWLFMAVVNLPRPPPFPERTPPRNSRPYDQRLNHHWFPMFLMLLLKWIQ